MAAPSVTYTFTNLTAADATEVNQNFQDIIDGITDGTKDITVGLLQANDDATFNADVTLGNATGDAITFTGRVSSDIDPTTAATNTLGDATQTWRALYLDNTATDGGAIYFDGGSTEFIKANAAGTALDLGGFTHLDIGSGASIKTFGVYAEAKSADYTITDTDGVSVVLMTTSTTNRTVTLPTAGDNPGRTITVKKMDSGSGIVTVDGEGSETIDGSTTKILTNQYDWATFICDGTNWAIFGLFEKPKIAKYTLSGNQGIADGATATIIWNAITTNTFGGTPMNTSTGVFTVPTGESGVYSICAQVSGFEDTTASLTAVDIGILINGAGIANSSRTEQNDTGGTIVEYQRETRALSTTINLASGDLITVTGAVNTSAGASAIFRGSGALCNVVIAKIG